MATSAVASLDWAVLDIDLLRARSSADVRSVVRSAIACPWSEADNWDALADMLSDLSWRRAPGYLVVIREASGLIEVEPLAFNWLVQLTVGAIWNWRIGQMTPGHPDASFHVVCAGSDVEAQHIRISCLERVCEHRRDEQIKWQPTDAVQDLECFRRAVASIEEQGISRAIDILCEPQWSEMHSHYALCALARPCIADAAAIRGPRDMRDFVEAARKVLGGDRPGMRLQSPPPPRPSEYPPARTRR